MTAPAPRWSDKQVEQLVGNLLRYGVLGAAAVVLCGGLLLLAHHGLDPVEQRWSTPEPTALRSLRGIVAGALRLDARSVVQLGVVFLIATPIARVFLSLVAFVLQKDRLYVVITAIVLAVLLYSLLLSGAL